MILYNTLTCWQRFESRVYLNCLACQIISCGTTNMVSLGDTTLHHVTRRRPTVALLQEGLTVKVKAGDSPALSVQGVALWGWRWSHWFIRRTRFNARRCQMDLRSPSLCVYVMMLCLLRCSIGGKYKIYSLHFIRFMFRTPFKNNKMCACCDDLSPKQNKK